MFNHGKPVYSIPVTKYVRPGSSVGVFPPNGVRHIEIRRKPVNENHENS